jgi:hypothetical protein
MPPISRLERLFEMLLRLENEPDAEVPVDRNFGAILSTNPTKVS